MATSTQHIPSALLPSSIFSTPSFTSTLPLGGARPTSASSVYPRRTTAHPNSRMLSRRMPASLRRRARSTASSDVENDSDDGSLRDLSMENYTIDLAVLARRESGRIGRLSNDEDSEKKRQLEEEEEAEEEEEEEEDGVNRDVQDANENGRPRSETDHEGEASEDGSLLLDDYEVDLGGFGDKPSSVAIEDPLEEREEVLSVVDGPEDFTLNMGAWMKGHGKAVKERDVPSDLDEQKSGGLQPQLEEEATLGFGDGDASSLEPMGTSTPSTKLNGVDHVTSQQQKAQVDKRPLLIRGETELQQDQAAEEVFERISALQAEVEEMREAEEARRAAFHSLSQENELLKKGQARLRILEDNNLTVMKQNADLQARIEERKPNFATTASAMGSSSTSESQAAELMAKEVEAERAHIASDERIQALEAGVKASHIVARKLREEMATNGEMHTAKIEGLKEDLENLRADIDVRNGQIADLEQDIDTHAEIVKHRDQLIARLTADAQVARTELEHAQQEARESRRIAQAVEEENDRLTGHNSRRTEEMAAMDIALQNKIRDLQNANDTVATLQDTLQGAMLEDGEIERRNEVSHQAALDALKEEHSKTLTALNQKFARQLQLFKQDRDTQASKHATELAKAKETTPLPHTAMETELRSAIRVLSSKLEKANHATREAEAALETTQTELQHARQGLAATKRDNELTNAELDARFADAMNARETEWRRRVAVLFRERERMGKALMAGWGREDVGKEVMGGDGGQGYRYRFVGR